MQGSQVLTEWHASVRPNLHRHLNKGAREAVRRSMSIRQLLDLAIEHGVFLDGQDHVMGWTKLRNDAVHTDKPVTRNDAKAVVEGVERIIAAL